MRELLIGAIVAMVGIFLALLVIIAGSKLWRDGRERRFRRRRRALEPPILELIGGRHASVEAAVGRSTAARDLDVLERILLALARRREGDERGRLSAAFEELGLTDRYLRELAAPTWWRRADAAERLGQSGAVRAVEPLTRALADDSPEVRLRAAQALAELGGPTALRPLIHALGEANRWYTIRIAQILAGQGQAIAPELLAVFPQLEPAARPAVIDILGEVASASIGEWLCERLGDDDENVRARAAHALGWIGDPAAGPALTRALHDRAWQVRAMAAKAVGLVAYGNAIPNLAIGLRDDAWWVRNNCAEALLAVGPEGLDTLVLMLEDVDAYAAQQAVSALQDAGVIDEKVNALAALEPETRNAARFFVERLIAVGQLQRLRELARTHSLEAVRRQLDDMLPLDGAAREGAA